ncbi:LysM peptidoglycan-binding domain-containing protein [Stutzerimonas kirkiae]|uniref:LysM peptidoglycan-binding domain-containing protein n=1 Tax=Stutzerimonas kirkiae TaxID=2211392 RepID=UPI0010385DB2|nr:LysM peptidoglycan-binding domain-containing protein [Stutzerimonas kirkiae]TBV06900.1 peptidoglycan-binding protein [Stutzerimonas kirkiae]TBV10401.1 peptidoglycan-binding protein [Stutzerimonas kirkiae]
MRKSLLILLLLASSGLAQAQLALREDHPQSYSVAAGDTLWDIATRFLDKPWQWPGLWHDGTALAAPHLHPGDRLSLVLVDEQPRLLLEPAEASASEAIPGLPQQPIRDFLSAQRILDSLAPLATAPYVVAGSAERLLAGNDERIHGRGRFDPALTDYDLVREGKSHIDPDTQEVLGIQLDEIGSARLEAIEDDIATLHLQRVTQEARLGDRLLPAAAAPASAPSTPSEPARLVEGRIIDTPWSARQGGPFEVVTLNRGSREGLAEGNILAAYGVGESVRDPLTGEWVKMPDERLGLLMVFHIHDKLSHGLVLQATRPLSIYDRVRNP